MGIYSAPCSAAGIENSRVPMVWHMVSMVWHGTIGMWHDTIRMSHGTIRKSHAIWQPKGRRKHLAIIFSGICQVVEDKTGLLLHFSAIWMRAHCCQSCFLRTLPGRFVKDRYTLSCWLTAVCMYVYTYVRNSYMCMCIRMCVCMHKKAIGPLPSFGLPSPETHTRFHS